MGQLVNWFDGPMFPSMEVSDGELKIHDVVKESSYFDALENFHRKRCATLERISRTKQTERDDPEIATYREELSNVREYAKLCPREQGLKGELLAPWVPLGNDWKQLIG